MRTIEDGVQITGSIYECREALLFLHGSDYAERVQPWKRVIRRGMKRGERVLSVALALARSGDDVPSTLWLMAAAAEIIEEDAPKLAEDAAR